MKLESLREIKHHFLGNSAATFAVGIARPQQKMSRSIALGIGAQGKLAVRCYGNRNQSRLQTAFVEAILKHCHGEADVIRGLEMPMAYGWMDELLRRLSPPEKRENQGRVRPVAIGWSVGHYRVSAGTVSAMCKVKGDKRPMLLSNAHVIANSNDCKVGDVITQPGKYDGGSVEKDTVATLHSWVKLKKEHNKVDGAVAVFNDGIEFDPATVGPYGNYGGANPGVEVGMEVRKFGRTTGARSGTITAIEVDNLRVNYGPPGTLSFDSQFEISNGRDDNDDEQSVSNNRIAKYLKSLGFSAPGDSGSHILNTDNQGVGLLFAGNGTTTYANDLQDVLDQLKITMLK
jgi:hypothetical protein